MLDKASIIPELLKRLDRLPIGECIDVRSYKRDRSLLIVKTDADLARVIENGFSQSDNLYKREAWKRELKALVKHEFPRSTKLRLYNLGKFQDQHTETHTRKRI